MVKDEFFAEVSNNTLKYDYPNLFYKTLCGYNNKKVIISIRENVEKKTLSQLNYYVGIIIKKYCMNDNQFGGHEYNDIIVYFLERIFGYEKEYKIKNKIKIMTIYPSLSSLSIKEMNILIDRTIQILLTEFGIEVEEENKFKQ